jgi:hypothetical protein
LKEIPTLSWHRCNKTDESDKGGEQKMFSVDKYKYIIAQAEKHYLSEREEARTK